MKKTYLSYSQITLWLSSKKTYIQKYFEGLEGYQTDAMKIGTAVHRVLPKFYGNDGVKYEYELRGAVDGVEMLAYLDMLNEDRHIIYEFKTGMNNGVAWDKEGVDNHLQLHIYYIMYNEIFNIEPIIFLGKLPKKTSFEEKDVDFIRYTPDNEKIQKTRELIARVRKEIDEAYEKWLSEKGKEVEIDVDLLEELYVLQEDLTHIQSRISEIKEELQGMYKDGIEYGGVNMYKIEKKTYDFSTDENINKIKAFSDEYSALLKDAQDNFKKLNAPTKVDVSYGFRFNK